MPPLQQQTKKASPSSNYFNNLILHLVEPETSICFSHKNKQEKLKGKKLLPEDKPQAKKLKTASSQRSASHEDGIYSEYCDI